MQHPKTEGNHATAMRSSPSQCIVYETAQTPQLRAGGRPSRALIDCADPENRCAKEARYAKQYVTAITNVIACIVARKISDSSVDYGASFIAEYSVVLRYTAVLSLPEIADQSLTDESRLRAAAAVSQSIPPLDPSIAKHKGSEAIASACPDDTDDSVSEERRRRSRGDGDLCKLPANAHRQTTADSNSPLCTSHSYDARTLLL